MAETSPTLIGALFLAISGLFGLMVWMFKTWVQQLLDTVKRLQDGQDAKDKQTIEIQRQNNAAMAQQVEVLREINRRLDYLTVDRGGRRP